MQIIFHYTRYLQLCTSNNGNTYQYLWKLYYTYQFCFVVCFDVTQWQNTQQACTSISRIKSLQLFKHVWPLMAIDWHKDISHQVFQSVSALQISVTVFLTVHQKGHRKRCIVVSCSRRKYIVVVKGKLMLQNLFLN